MYPMKTIKPLLAAICFITVLLVFSNHSFGAVVDSSAFGFTIKQDLLIKQNTDSVYRYFIFDIGKWWNPQHTWSGNSANLVIQPKANGCFCERLENTGSVRHMMVEFLEPGSVLRMSGALGPLQALAVTGIVTLQYKKVEEGTLMTMTYTVGGYDPAGLRNMAVIVDGVWADQLSRFKDFCETKK
jgi:hypothetical protein